MESAYIDVVIATIFLFVTLSLIVTTITQGVTQTLQLRFNNLKAGLVELLGAKLADSVMDTRFILSSKKGRVEHIEPRQFANALIQLHRESEEQFPKPVNEVFRMLTEAAQGEASSLRQEIEAWFDAAMAEAGVWFRKYTQKITMVVAALVVIVLNADALALIDQAWRDRALRDSLVAAAAATVEESASAADQEESTEPGSSLAEVREQLDAAWGTFPLGWPETISVDLRKVLGLLITFVAINLGAPFWFDVLKRVMKLRAQIQKAKE